MTVKNRSIKTAMVLAALLAAGLSQPQTAKAGLVADAWWAVFGPPGTPYYGYAAGYGPTYRTAGYYGGYTTNYYAGYAPSGACCPQQVYYVPSCNPCQPSCPTNCDPCRSGRPCQTSSSNATGNGPQTFRKETGDIQPPVPGKDDSNFESREGSKKFEKTRPEVKDGGKSPTPAGVELGKPAPGFPGSGDGGAGATKREALKPTGEPPAEKGPVIRQNKPVPAKAPVEGGKVNEKTARTIDRVHYDRKITWRPAAERTRLVIRPVIATQTIARTTVAPKTDWKPGTKTQVVQK